MRIIFKKNINMCMCPRFKNFLDPPLIRPREIKTASELLNRLKVSHFKLQIPVGLREREVFQNYYFFTIQYFFQDNGNFLNDNYYGKH